MDDEIVVDNAFVTLWYHSDTGILHHQIHKYAYGDTLRKMLLAGVDVMKKNNSCKWLSDDRRYAAISKEDTEWGTAVFIPAALKAGWRFWAIVLPTSVIGTMQYNQMAEELGKLGLKVELFVNINDAMKWLKAQ